jgi:methyl-accepting chemotaxis protein
MNSFKNSLQRHRSRLPFLVLTLVVPWGWSAFFVPEWVSVVSLALVLPTVALLMMVVTPAPEAAPASAPVVRRADDDGSLTDAEILEMRQRSAEQRERMAQTFATVQSHVNRWSETSENSQDQIMRVHEGMGKTMKLIEASVVDISNGFSAVMKNSTRQMELAGILLGSENDPTRPDGASGAWLSLPDYIRAYETQLNTVTERMLQFSSASNVFDEYRSKIRGQTVQVDEALDELRAMANRTGQLALESSMIASSADVNHQGVVALTDRIRTISEQTHELTRRIRASLDLIRTQITESHKAMHGASDVAEKAAREAKFELLQLNLTMTEKAKDVRNTLEEINKLGGVVQEDISRIIIAMQFQDITQQRLERLHQPALTRVISELRSIGEETSKVKGDVGQWLQSGAAESEAPFKLVRRGAEKPIDVPKNVAASVAASDLEDETKPLTKDGTGSVELF